MAGCGVPQAKAEASPVSIRMKDGCPEIPLIQGAEGAPVFRALEESERYVGRWPFYPAAGLYALSLSHASWPECVWEDLKTLGFRLAPRGSVLTLPEKKTCRKHARSTVLIRVGIRCSTDSCPVASRKVRGVMRYPDGGVYRGGWRAASEKDTGSILTPWGRTYSGYGAGILCARTSSGKRGMYEGFFNRRMEEHGEGGVHGIRRRVLRGEMEGRAA